MLHIIKGNLKNQMALKEAFLLQVVGMVINDAAFVFIWLLFFDIFGTINGWGKNETLLLQGILSLVYGFVFTFFAGVFNLADKINNGALDSILLTPGNRFIKTLISDIRTSAIGDVFYGIALIIIYFIINGVSFSTLLLLTLSIICGVVVFFSFGLISSLMAFLIPDSSDIAQQFYNIFMAPTMYPGGLFSKFWKIVLTVLVPSFLVSSVPVEIVRDLDLVKLVWAGLISLVWLDLAYVLFNVFIKRYSSSNLVGYK